MDGHELAVDASGTFYAVYLLRVIPAGGGAGGEAVLRRRYRQFQDLDGKLQALPAAHRPQRKDLPVMTSKRWGLGLRDDVVEKRKRKLAEYLYEVRAQAGGWRHAHA